MTQTTNNAAHGKTWRNQSGNFDQECHNSNIHTITCSNKQKHQFEPEVYVKDRTFMINYFFHVFVKFAIHVVSLLLLIGCTNI